MDGSIRALAMGAAFSLVAAGFAYAVPRAILTTAEQVIVEEAPIEVTDPIVDDSEEIEIEPLGGRSGKGSKGNGAKDNHGAAVSTGARCEVRGQAKGKLSSSLAKNKSAQVEDAEAACAEARAAEEASSTGGARGGGQSDPHQSDATSGGGGGRDQSSGGHSEADDVDEEKQGDVKEQEDDEEEDDEEEDDEEEADDEDDDSRAGAFSSGGEGKGSKD